MPGSASHFGFGAGLVVGFVVGFGGAGLVVGLGGVGLGLGFGFGGGGGARSHVRTVPSCPAEAE